MRNQARERFVSAQVGEVATRCGGYCARISTFVPDYAKNVVGVVVAGASGLPDCTKPVVVHCYACFHNNVVALADAYQKIVGCVRNNWDKIVRNDLEVL